MKTINLKPFALYSSALFFLLLSIYLLSYRGFPLSQDTYYIFDAAESLVHRGTFDLTYEFARDFRIPPDRGAPWLPSPQEPLNIILVAPFYWIGSQLSNVGTAHVLWLFSLFMSAFVGVNLFWGALWLRYPIKVAWWGALIFGIGTQTWTYSRFLFREPITTLFVLWCSISAIYVHQAWKKNESPVKGLLIFAVAFVGVFLSKEIGITLLPGLLLIILPPFKRIKWRGRILPIILMALLALGFLALVLFFSQFSTRFSVNNWITRLTTFNWSIFVESVLGYQISWSRSFWLHSPVLLVGLFSVPHIIKRGEWRILAGAGLMMLLLSGAYTSYSTSWWGNLGWGPRYMLILTPIFMIYVLDVMTHQLQTTTRKALFGAVVVLSVAVQIIGMGVPLSNYYTDMFLSGVLPELNVQTQWGAYNWQWEYSPLNYHIQHFNLATTDIAWLYSEQTRLIVGAIVGYMLICIGYVWLVFKYPWKTATSIISVVVMSVGALGLIGGAMVGIRDDVRYTEERDDVHELIQQLNQQVTRDQFVFVDRKQYQLAFMNHFKVPALVAILPYAPGENYDGTIPDVDPTNMLQTLGAPTYYTLSWAGRMHHPIWFVTSSSPFEPTKIRPIERYLTENFYPIEEITISDRARAIRYFMLDRSQIINHKTLTVVFDSKLKIVSINLPLGRTLSAGDVLPITINWVPTEPLENDYNISVRVIGADGHLLTQQDGTPIWTFGKMSTWEVDQIYRDNHGIQIPPNAPAGEYAVHVIVYRWQDGERLPVTHGGASPDEAFLFTLTIE